MLHDSSYVTTLCLVSGYQREIILKIFCWGFPLLLFTISFIQSNQHPHHGVPCSHWSSLKLFMCPNNIKWASLIWFSIEPKPIIYSLSSLLFLAHLERTLVSTTSLDAHIDASLTRLSCINNLESYFDFMEWLLNPNNIQ